MPLALLLQEVFRDVAEGIARLDPWNRLVAMELVLLDRARSAFLARWFGPRIPLQGQHLRIALENLESLRARYQEVNRAAAAAPAGLNLTEPLAGLSGQILGAVLSPAGILLAGALAVRRLQSWMGQLGGALLTIVATGVVPALAGGVGVLALPFAFLGAVLIGGINQEQARAVYDLLGALAEMLEALRRFVAQFFGPRQQVRNPLVRAVLEIADRLAVLLPFVMALFAIVFARVGGLLRPLAAQVVRLRALVEAVIEMVAFVVRDWLIRLTALYTDTSPTMELEIELGVRRATASGPARLVFGLLEGIVRALGSAMQQNPSPWTILQGALRSLMSIPAALLRGLTSVSSQLGTELERIGAAMGRLVSTWLTLANNAVREAILGHPTARAWVAGREIMTTLIEAFRRTASPSTSSPPPSTSSSGGSSGGSIPFLSPPPFPTFRPPDIAAIARRSGPAPLLDLELSTVRAVGAMIEEWLRQPRRFQGQTVHPFAYDPDTLESIRRAERAPSVFTAERLALRDTQDRTPAEQLAAAGAEEASLRNALLAVVGRVLPPAVATYLPQLESVFQTLEERLYPERPASGRAASEMPVLQVAENDRLQPVVHRLRILAAGGERPEARAWSDRLREVLLRQTYRAAPEGAAGSETTSHAL